MSRDVDNLEVMVLEWALLLLFLLRFLLVLPGNFPLRKCTTSVIKPDNHPCLRHQ